MVDKNARAFGLLAGRPNDPTWDDTVEGAAEAIRCAKEKLIFDKKEDRRAFEPDKDQDTEPFRTIADGVSYGNGQTVSDLTLSRWLCHE